MRLKPYYYAYYASILFMASGVLNMLLYPITGIGSDMAILISNLLMAIGMTIALLTTIKYWGWLIKELR